MQAGGGTPGRRQVLCHQVWLPRGGAAGHCRGRVQVAREPLRLVTSAQSCSQSQEPLGSQASRPRASRNQCETLPSHLTQRAARVILFIYFYFLLSYLWVYFGHQGQHPRELQILPYLTNQAFDVGCDQRRPSERLPNGNASGRLRGISLRFQSRRKTTFRFGWAPRSQKAKLIGSA